MFTFLRSLLGKNDDALQQALQNGAVIIDVRTPAEYKQGHIKGSKNIPLDEVKLKADFIRKWNKPVITVCRSGSRSALAKNILTAGGVQVVNGGSWTSLQKTMAS